MVELPWNRASVLRLLPGSSQSAPDALTSFHGTDSRAMEAELLLWMISWLTTVSTIGLYLSGVSLCLKVKRQGDTNGVTMVPFLVTASNCACWLKYGFLQNDSTLKVVNTVGLSLELGYVIFYYAYTKLTFRRYVVRSVFLTIFVMGGVFVTADYVSESPAMVFGYVGCLTAVGVYASPLAAVSQVLRLKSSEYLSFPLCAAGLIVSLEWCLYGFLLGDLFLYFPNIFGVLLGAFQMDLFRRFPAGPTKGLNGGASYV